MTHLVEPPLEQILEYCAEDPVERVFLEDVARRGLGRFSGLEDGRPSRRALPHGRERRPLGRGLRRLRGGRRTRARADADRRAARGLRALGGARGSGCRRRARTGRASPSTRSRRAPEPGETGLRPAALADLDLLVPACALAHEVELGIDPLQRDADGFRWRTRAQIEEGRSWLWEEDGVILFKAEASAWTPSAVQLQQVWTDPEARGQGLRRAAGCAT